MGSAHNLAQVFVIFAVLTTATLAGASKSWRLENPPAKYGESCSDHLPCDPSKNMTCTLDTQICECIHDISSGERWYYHENVDGCLPNIRDHPHHVHEDEIPENEIHDEEEKEGETAQLTNPSTGIPCSGSYDCERAVGSLSRCFEGRCQCHDTIDNGKRETAFINGKCYLKKNVGEHCEEDNECRGGHPDLNCRQGSNSYKICTCPEGKKCSNSGANAGIFVSATLILLAVFANSIII